MPSDRSATEGAATGASRGAKWGRRVSLDPFTQSSADELEPAARGKENTAPSSTHSMPTTTGIMTSTVIQAPRDGSARAASAPKATTAVQEGLLGKRQRLSHGSSSFESHKTRRISSENKDAQRALLQEAEDAVSASEDQENNVLIVNDFVRVAELYFGEVALGQRKTLLLILMNPSQVGSARIKYEGYIITGASRENPPPQKQSTENRFKCDLHVCAVPAASKTTLRITFEPLVQDVNHELVGMMRFMVNDQFRLHCKVVGTGVPAAASSKRLSLRDRLSSGAMSQEKEVEVPPAAVQRRGEERSPLATIGTKRLESFALVVSPPRHRTPKKARTNPTQSEGADTSASTATTGGFHGSWWEKRKTLSDEEWMQRQEKGFTEWMNHVLVDSTGGAPDAEVSEPDMIIDHPHLGLLTPSRRQRRRTQRIDFSSLRVLAMKRMESMWSRSAMEIYRSDEVTLAAANLKNEIAEGKLVVRRDRPAYADVGLQGELVELLNNYHPVWLCLALETVLGHRVMAQEKCSLRSVMTYCAAVANEQRTKAKKKPVDEGKTNKVDRMPRQLRRVIMQHLLHDPHVAKRHRLVKNLKTPVEAPSGTLRAGKANPKISGRDYFDALMDSFVFKFFMIVLVLDRAAAHRSDKFVRFPCLFRVTPPTAKPSDDESIKRLKNSQSLVTEFCRLFLSKEGRIDKHMKQLGYSVTFQQVPLDEVDLEVRNIAVDLRDGVRLAKLLEILTANPSTPTGQQPLSSFLRVPAMSRLQKVHNVEVCLHFLQEKCGRNMLEGMRAAYTQNMTKKTKSFATLRDKEDSKLVETMAKAVVDGHRERTLSLLWKLISVFQLRSLVNVDKLTKEIQTIKQRMSFSALEFYESTAVNLPALSEEENAEGGGLDQAVRELLLEWCKAVCANYFIRVTDFTESFADGRVLCYLLHYYHPMLVTKAEITFTTVTMAGSSTRPTEADIVKAHENERRHFTMANDRVKQLGEVPVLLPEQYDSTNPPDEKVIVTFVCYLQSRLIDSSREIYAAARLKRWWRSPRIRLLMRRKKNRAAKMIQRMWYTSSVKRLAIRRCRRLLYAARMIAGYMSAWIYRARFLKFRRAVVSLQRQHRRTHREQDQMKHQWQRLIEAAATAIQTVWRRYEVAKRIQQRAVRKQQLCRKLKHEISAHRITNALRVNMQQKRDAREALKVYQEVLYQQRLEAGKKKLMKKVHARSALKVQTTARQFLYRRMLERKQLASICMIQRAVRSWIAKRQHEARERYRQMLIQQDRERRVKLLALKVEKRSARLLQHVWQEYKFKKANTAATKIQAIFRASSCRQLLHAMKAERNDRAATVLQACARQHLVRRRYTTARRGIVLLQAAVRGVLSRLHVLNFSQFQFKAKRMRRVLAKWKLEAWTKTIVARRRRQHAAAVVIQKTWRMHIDRICFHIIRASAVRIQALVKGVQSRRYRFDYAVFRARMDHLQCLRATRIIGTWWRSVLDRYEEKQHSSATAIQARFRARRQRTAYVSHRSAIVKLQAAVRGVQSRQHVLNFREFKWRAMGSQKRLAAWRIQSWVLRCVTWYNLRVSAATIIQSRFRGAVSRAFVLDFAVYKANQARHRQKMAVWKLQHWFHQLVVDKRVDKSAVLLQKTVRGFLARSKYVDHVARVRAAQSIARCWRVYQFRQVLHARVVTRLTRDFAAKYIQDWWSGRLAQTTAKQELVLRRAARAVKMERVRKVSAASKIQSAWKRKSSRSSAKKKVVGLKHMREYYAAGKIRQAVFAKLLRAQRSQHKYLRAVGRVQSWWRGMLVRLHEKRQAVTAQRKKLASMTLVTPEPPSFEVPSATSSAPVYDTSKPLTLGTRLELALHMLLHGKRLQDMLFASHTIELCTRYSRECVAKCVQLKISRTIFAAIRGLNRSRPHVELLHQLLLVLINLSSSTEQQPPRETLDQDDLRAVDALVDLLHVHRDMHVVFVLASRLLKQHLRVLQPHTDASNHVFNQWSEAHRRLCALYELLNKKMQVAAWSAKLLTPVAAAAPSGNATSPNANVMAKINPKTAVSVMTQLLKVFEA